MKIKSSLLLLLCIMFFGKIYAFNVNVDVLNSDTTPIKVAMVSFYSDDKSAKLYAGFVSTAKRYFTESAVINFIVIEDNMITKDKSLDQENIDISIYDAYDYVVFGKMRSIDKEYNTEIAVFNVANKDKVLSKRYVFKADKLKNSTHWLLKNLTNDIYSSSSGLAGYFNTSLLYVANEKEIMIADFNGENSKVLLKSRHSIYSPVFSPNENLIAYVEAVSGISRIYLYSLQDKKAKPRLIGSFRGLSLSPRFSDDGKFIVFALAHEGATNIVEVNLDNGRVRRLTRSGFINLPGGYIDNDNLLFYSDNSGKSEIYTMNLKDLSLNKISKREGNYFTPSYSKSYSMVAFTKILNKIFYIGVLDLEGRERIVSQDVFAESPSWAADGRHLIYQYLYKLDNKRNYYTFAFLDVLTGKKTIINPQSNIQDPVLSKNSLFFEDSGVEYNLLNK